MTICSIFGSIIYFLSPCQNFLIFWFSSSCHDASPLLSGTRLTLRTAAEKLSVQGSCREMDWRRGNLVRRLWFSLRTHPFQKRKCPQKCVVSVDSRPKSEWLSTHDPTFGKGVGPKTNSQCVLWSAAYLFPVKRPSQEFTGNCSEWRVKNHLTSPWIKPQIHAQSVEVAKHHLWRWWSILVPSLFSTKGGLRCVSLPVSGYFQDGGRGLWVSLSCTVIFPRISQQIFFVAISQA